MKYSLVCGKGFPSIATRAFVSRLEKELDLPTLMLTDCNPAGLMIMLNYRQGSTKSSIEGSEFGGLCCTVHNTSLICSTNITFFYQYARN